MPVISAFCSPESGVRVVWVTLGWGLGAERVVRLGLLLVVFARVTGAFLVEGTLRDRAEVERDFAVVLVFVGVGFLLVVRVAIKFSAEITELIIHFGRGF